ncbi:hypothetical protein ACFFIS_06245 [Virgibacillus soli]|uniref:Uncharacterized protein n=1 Tax=Paracerasibacillus soli TaxID=480284 RepID=A0ABU5CRM6_9BACI|nr:hypothetical protein [Virgibacillus soli]MDY0409024.1 hypothetical protein [Virgibacillus soli]MDY0409793.1 hypothetical protein [Virgibacillus soli]
MAESWAKKKHLSFEWGVKSAGLEAYGLNPDAYNLNMNEKKLHY